MAKAVYSGLGQDGVRVTWFWAHSDKKHTSLDSVLAEKRPDGTKYLLANVYADVNGLNRIIGSSNFPLTSLLQNKTVTSEVLRHHSPSKAGKLSVSGHHVDPKNMQAPTLIESQRKAIGNLFNNSGHRTYGYKTVEAHEKFWKDPFKAYEIAHHGAKRPSDAYTHDALRYFRMPLWWFGSGYVVPGPHFCWHRPVRSSGEEALMACLGMARDRAALYKEVSVMTTTERELLLSYFLAAYSHCIPYSIEMDPSQKNKPSEYFSAARIRATGDCEDTSYEIIQTFRDLVEAKRLTNPNLVALRNFAMGYTAWMTLGSATASDAGTTGSKKESIMAHMYVLLIPNAYLQALGVDILSRPTPEGRQVLLVEGTGCVHPHQKPDTEFPHYMSPKGKVYMDKMLKEHQLGALRRFIFNPPGEHNDHVTAEFYKAVVSAVADSPDIGMYAFYDAEGRVGPPLPDILAQRTDSVRMMRIPGTRSSDAEAMADASRIWAMKGHHEPINALYPSEKTLPSSRVVGFVNSLPRLGDREEHDVQFVMPMAEVGTDNETKVLKQFEKDRAMFASGLAMKHNIGNSGAFLFRFKLA